VAVRILNAQSDDEIAMCYPVVSELRPHLQEKDFFNTISNLAKRTGFKLAYLTDGNVKAVAGYRVSEWLHSGKYLEIEDLITRSTDRSKGYGGQLFDWLVAQARLEDCRQLRLVSGVKRTDAHRFYSRKGMVHEAQYFSLNL
jgi:GNAT superfamily N-acetyltransferase